MVNQVDTMREKISSLVDGEWDDHELETLMNSLDEGDEIGAVWREYHLIGDAIAGRPVLSDNFLERFSVALEAEPIVVAPARVRRAGRYMRGKVRAPKRHWVALSMAASVAVVSATAWFVSRSANPGMEGEVIVAVNKPVMQVNAMANPYLVAHQALIGNPGFSARPVILSGAEIAKLNSVSAPPGLVH